MKPYRVYRNMRESILEVNPKELGWWVTSFSFTILWILTWALRCSLKKRDQLDKGAVLTKSDKRTQRKIFWKSWFVWPVCFPLLKEWNHPFFLQAEACRSGGAGLTVCFGSDEYIWFPFTMFISGGAEGPAYLSKPEEFSLQLCLIEGSLLLPPSIKVVTSTTRCDSL